MVTQVNCPHCAQTVKWNADSPYRPFCSKRCRLIDLGEWFNEEHTIAGEEVDPMAPQAQQPGENSN